MFAPATEVAETVTLLPLAVAVTAGALTTAAFAVLTGRINMSSAVRKAAGRSKKCRDTELPRFIDQALLINHTYSQGILSPAAAVPFLLLPLPVCP